MSGSKWSLTDTLEPIPKGAQAEFVSFRQRILLRYLNRSESKGISRPPSHSHSIWDSEEGDESLHSAGVRDPGNCQRATLRAGLSVCDGVSQPVVLEKPLWFPVGRRLYPQSGRYLVLVPTGVAAATFDTRPGTEFFGWDVSSNLSVYPSDNLTVRLRSLIMKHRFRTTPVRRESPAQMGTSAVVFYSPDGTISTCAPSGWTPDLANAETKLILALLFRL